MSKKKESHVESRMVVASRDRTIGLIVRYTIIAVAIVFALFPVLFIVSSAFNPTGQLSTQSLIPAGVDSPEKLLTNFRALMVDELDVYPFWNWIGNSFFVATISTILVVLITALSAYSFSRFRFAGRRSMLLGILLIQVFPNLLAIVSLSLLLQAVGRLADAIPEAIPALSFIS